ncbi:monocarboxylate transporter [Scheffersomyces coipomensis]|uniref:monocarboxylate transporter n=1 Tax=Scheffersomyces coipomensis TaxID=1788519 RepID=UPI00315D383C
MNILNSPVSEMSNEKPIKSNPDDQTKDINKDQLRSLELTREADDSQEDSNVAKESIDVEKQIVTEDRSIDRGYAWVICFASFLINFASWGQNSGFAIYFSYYLNNDTFKGATKMDYSFIGGIAFGVGLSFSPVINYMMGKVGTRPTIAIGNCLQFTALMLASFSRKKWQLYLTQGLMQSFGLALVSIPGTTILPQYFKKKRVLSGGLATAGSGVGGICFNLGMQHVVETKSVFWALRIQSIIGFILVWIAIILIRTKDKKINIQFTAFDKDIVQTAGFWIFALFVITCMFGYVVVLYTLAEFTTALGYSEYQGSIVSAMVQLGSALGRPCVGLLADKFGGVTVATGAYTIVGILCLAMCIPARTFGTAIAFALFTGALMGSIYGMLAPAVARTFGFKKMNVTFSMIWMIMGVAGLFSPVIGIKLKRGEGGFVDPTQYVDCSIFAGVSFLAAALCLLLLRGYIKARDFLSEQGDSDNMDPIGLTVTPMAVITSCFKASHEKT